MDTPSYHTDQFCIVIMAPRIFSSKMDLKVDFGSDANSANPLLQNETEAVKEMSSVVDALNYMAKKGWQMVNAYSLTSSTTAINEQHYLMKKASR